MKPRAKVRNVDTIRNVLVDELVNQYVEEIIENNGIEGVMHLYREVEGLQRVASRLRINFPSPSRLVGLVLRRVSDRL